MTPFRQPINPGDTGGDVWAVKRAYTKMGVKGAGALAQTRTAGPAFVAVTRTVQRQHSLKADGVYGPATHAIVAPHFDAYGVALYRAAKIRKPPLPPVPSGDAQAEARKLLTLHGEGKYRADNPGDLRDVEAAAAGRAVWSQGGYWVHIDPRPLRLLVWLIERGHELGTFALCSDHRNDGPHGHAGGLATDISSIDGISVGSHEARAVTLELARQIRGAPSGLVPRQLICDGYGGVHDAEISACTIPNADFYGYETMSEHRNHVHCGY